MSEELGQLEVARQEAWTGWERSKSVLRPEGDVRFLEMVRKTSGDIIKLLGINDPVEFNAKRVHGEDGSDAHVDVVEIVVSHRDELKEITDEHGTISLRAFKERLKQSVIEEAKQATRSTELSER